MSNFQTLGSLSQSKLFALLDVPQEQREDLIETNIRQRGDVSSSSLKMGRIIQKLEEIYGVRQGSAGKVSLDSPMDTPKQGDIAESLGIENKDTYLRYKKLTTLIPEIQDLVDDKVSFSQSLDSCLGKFSLADSLLKYSPFYQLYFANHTIYPNTNKKRNLPLKSG